MAAAVLEYPFLPSPSPGSFHADTQKPLDDYTSYKGLPPLAGLCTVAEAAKPGLSVEECVRRLKRFHYAFKRLHEILTARITAEPIYELKTAFAHHAYLCAEHVTALRHAGRRDARAAAGAGGRARTRRWRSFFDEILAAPTTAELLVGVYEKALPALDAAHRRATWPRPTR